jgi:hypothetical protein
MTRTKPVTLAENMEGKLRDLSGVCSALWATRDLENETEYGLQAYHAPSECGAITYAGITHSREQIAAKWGWDLIALKQELLRRVDHRWLHFSGMLDLLC